MFSMNKADLTKLHNALSSVTEELKIAYKDGEWRIIAVDPAHVALIEITVPKGVFLETEDGEGTVSMKMESVKRVLSIAEDRIDIEFGEKITMRTGKITRKMPNLYLDSADPKMPNLSIPNKITIDLTDIRKAMGVVSFTDFISVKMSPNGTTFTADGDVGDSVEAVYPEARVSEEVTSCYPLEYFITAVKMLPTIITVSMDNDYPMMMESDEGMHIRYLLAPRIESE